MDIKYLKKVLEIFDESTATELSIVEENTKIKLSKHKKDISKNSFQAMQAAPMPVPMPQDPAPSSAAAEPQPKESAKNDAGSAADDNMHTVNSPMVGTFYRAPSPDAEPFVEVGTRVTAGQTLCIIEAMKLMNEIESDVSGTVQKILLENAKPVEYNEPIFVIKPD